MSQLQKLQNLVNKVTRPIAPTTQTGTCLMVSLEFKYQTFILNLKIQMQTVVTAYFSRKKLPLFSLYVAIYFLLECQSRPR